MSNVPPTPGTHISSTTNIGTYASCIGKNEIKVEYDVFFGERIMTYVRESVQS